MQCTVDHDRAGRHRQVPGVGQLQQIGTEQVGQRAAAFRRDAPVVPRVDHQRRAGDGGDDGVDLLHRGGRAAGELSGDQHLGRGLQAPGDAVLHHLVHVRLGDQLREEELQEPAVVAAPVVVVVLRPALVGVQRLGARVDGPGGQLRCERLHVRVEQDDAEHPVRVPARGHQRAERGCAVPDQHRSLRAGRIEHVDQIADQRVDGVLGGVSAAPRPAVAQRVGGDHAVVPGEVGHLGLPHP